MLYCTSMRFARAVPLGAATAPDGLIIVCRMVLPPTESNPFLCNSVLFCGRLGGLAPPCAARLVLDRRCPAQYYTDECSTTPKDPSMITQLLDSLNPAQRQAVQAADGPILVLAGPGSG